MKNLIEQSIELDKKKQYKQSFSLTEKKYVYNKVTKELEEDGEIDIPELVQSYYTTTFDNVLDSYIETQDDGQITDRTNYYKNDFDALQEASMVLNDIIDEYNLPDDTSFKQAQEFLKNKIKGGEKVEEKTQDIEKVVSSDVQENGSQGSQA